MHLRIELSRRVQVVVISSQATIASDQRNQKKERNKNTYAALNCLACSGVSIPSVVHTSIPMLLTSRTIWRIRSNPLFLPARSRQAAPIQKRVLPFSLARRAASRTGSMSSNLEAFVGVEYRED